MSGRRSDALSALIVEVVEADAAIEGLRADEEITRQEYVAARQALDQASARTKDAVERREATGSALALIASRDAISEDTLDALIVRARRGGH